MKLNIELEFVDKLTGELHKIGDVITVTKARGDELLADHRNLVSLNSDEPVKSVNTKATKSVKK